MTRGINNSPATNCLRCAIYTRTATIVEADRSNSIQSQRSAAESYITGHADNGWVLLPDRYDDEGFSGRTVDRPGLRQLLQDVKDGGIDCVVVYSFDRLCREMDGLSDIMLTLNANEVLLAVVMGPPVLGEQVRSFGRLFGGTR
jgi:site-specific DNA recombinase